MICPAVATIVHLTPRDILRHPKYKQFISWFPDPTQHILVTESSTVKNPVMKKSSILHTKLHLLDPALFPALHNYIEEPYEYDFQENCRPGKNMLKYRLRPVVKRGFDEGKHEYHKNLSGCMHSEFATSKVDNHH